MAERKQDTGTGNAVGTSTHGSVNVVPPGSISLYDEQGHALHVRATDADYWLKKGFRREPHDLSTMRDELDVIFDAAKKAVLEYADHAVEADELDGSDEGLLRQAYVAMSNLWDAYARLDLSATIAKPVANGAVAVTIRENGVDIQVDPNQVDPKSRAPRSLAAETDPAIVPEVVKQQRAKAALDDAGVPDELRPRHLRNDPTVEGIIS